MPTYEYACRSCGHRFDEFQSIKAAPLKKCPECGKAALERLIGTGAALIFKGSGFYQTDYRSESYKKAAEAESKPTGTAESGATGNGATKPAETTANGKPEPKAERAAEAGGPAKAAPVVAGRTKSGTVAKSPRRSAAKK